MPSLAHSYSRLTMIRSNLSPPPTFPATFWDLVPFLCAGSLALISTALLILLVEDDSSDSRVHSEQWSHLASHQRRFVGLSEKEREWSTRFVLELLQLFSYPEKVHGLSSFGHCYCQVQPPPAPDVSKEIIWCVPTALGSLFFVLVACSKAVHFAHTRPFIALPPSPTSP